MRVTSFMLHNTGILNINKNYRELDKLTYQGSTLKKVRYSSDSPIDTVNQMKYKSEGLKIDQYLTNITDAKSWLNTMDSVLGQTKESLQRARVLTVQAANDTYTDKDRELVAEEINQILETLVEEANSTIGGSFLFGGTEILDDPFNQKPFKVTRGTSQDSEGVMKDVITEVEYTGDYKPVYREIETNTLIKINENGNEVFMATPNKIQIPATASSASQVLSELNGVSGGSRGYFKINDEQFYFDTDKDSLLDIKNLINSKDIGVDANIEGQLTGAATFADSTSALGFSGTFKINGRELSIVASDSMSDVVTKINSLTSSTGVSASIGQNNNLILDGGVEFGFSKESGIQTILNDLGLVDYNKITSSRSFSASNAPTDIKGGTFEINGVEITIADNASVEDIVNAINTAAPVDVSASYDFGTNQIILTGTPLNNLTIRDSLNDASLTSDVMSKLGFLTKSGDVKLNIESANVTNYYKLTLTSENNHQIYLEDVKDAHFLRDAGVITGNVNQKSPNNVTAAAQVEKRSIFDVLIKLRDDLLNSNVTDLNGADIGYIDSALDNIIARDSAVGAKVNRIETVEGRLGTLKINNEELLGNSEEVDFTEVITKLQQMQNVQNAALKINAQIFDMTLMDYL
ncbi:flagellar hook-associated protein FlgL [Candidatus Dependentiae bacterium]|nr:flagellar hook-associated protein FlgL [Candidatus Dependentiae bacterium]